MMGKQKRSNKQGREENITKTVKETEKDFAGSGIEGTKDAVGMSDQDASRIKEENEKLKAENEALKARIPKKEEKGKDYVTGEDALRVIKERQQSASK